MDSVAQWFQKLPRNSQESVQRLTTYGWLRIIIIVAAYLLIRPYLMKLAARSQTTQHEEAASNSTVTPNMLRGHNEEESDTAEATTSSWSWGKTTRRRQTQAIDHIVEDEIKKADDLDEDEDVQFLKKYCT